MGIYDAIVSKLQDKVNSGELTLEDANKLNDIAYDKYVIESSDDSADEEIVEKLLEAVKKGAKLSKDAKEAINDMLSEDDDASSDTSDDDEKSDEE